MSSSADPAKKVSANADPVKAGYWFSTSDLKVENIKSKLFTHLYAGFARVQYPIPSSKTIDDVIDIPDSRLKSFPQTVKMTNPGVKALLSIGGEGPDDDSTAIDSVVRNAESGLRDAFIKKSIKLARENDYDGLDLCWMYPSNTSLPSDLVSFLKDWRKAVKKNAVEIGKKELLLTAAVFHHPVKDGFNYPVQDLSENLDRINVLAIDFYTPSNSELKTGPVHAWFNLTNGPCGHAGIVNWIKNIGDATDKLVLGLPFYGYEWTLNDPNDNAFFAGAQSKTKQRVFYKRIRAIVDAGTGEGKYHTTYGDTYVATYSYNNERSWLGYDDGESISKKVVQASDNILGGYFAWHVGGDDDKWTLSTTAFKAWPQP